MAIAGTLLGGAILALSVAAFGQVRSADGVTGRSDAAHVAGARAGRGRGPADFRVNDTLTGWLFDMGTTGRFFLAMAVATGTGFVLGGLIETVLIRPLYDRPIYQIMLTLGLGFIVIELVRGIWGRPEFTMPKPELFSGSGADLPRADDL